MPSPPPPAYLQVTLSVYNSESHYFLVTDNFTQNNTMMHKTLGVTGKGGNGI